MVKTERERSMRRPWRRWTYTKIHLKGLGLEDVDWIDLAKDRGNWRAFVKMVMDFRVHKMQGIRW